MAAGAYTWTDQTASGTRGWNGIASSSDGSHLAAVAGSSGIYASTDYGVTWTNRTPAGTYNWVSIA